MGLEAEPEKNNNSNASNHLDNNEISENEKNSKKSLCNSEKNAYFCKDKIIGN